MQRRPLGNSGLNVSAIGFGCGGTGGVIGRGTGSQRLAVVSRAMDAGIDFFDTAPGYDGTRSESNLGETLRELGVRPTIGTKVQFQAEDLADIPGATARSVEASLRRLQVDTIDLLQIHNKISAHRRQEFPAELTPNEVLRPGGVADALDELRQQGKVRAVGFTAVGHLGAIEEIMDSGRFQTAEVVYNLLNPSAGLPVPAGFRGADYSGLLERAGANGISVVAIRVLAAGALAGTPASHPLTGGWAARASHDVDGDRERGLALGFLVPEGQTMAQAALRFALTHPNVATALVGFSEPSHIDQLAPCSEQEAILDEDLAHITGMQHPD